MNYNAQKREIYKGLCVPTLMIFITLLLALVRDYIKKEESAVSCSTKIKCKFCIWKMLSMFFIYKFTENTVNSDARTSSEVVGDTRCPTTGLQFARKEIRMFGNNS